jgi:hypothetical protein
VLALCGSVALAGLVGCDRGGGSNNRVATPDRTVCALLERLDRTGEAVAAVDARDPTAFDEALANAVQEYTEVLDELREAVPSELRDDVERLRAAVEQYRFTDGVDARAALAAHGDAACA